MNQIWRVLTWVERIEPSTTRNGLKGSFCQVMVLVFFTTPVGSGRDTLFDVLRGLACYAIPWSCPYSASADSDDQSDKSTRRVHYLTFYPGAKSGKEKMWICHDDIALEHWRDKQRVVLHFTRNLYVESGDDGIADNAWFRFSDHFHDSFLVGSHCWVSVWDLSEHASFPRSSPGLFFSSPVHSEEVSCQSLERRHCGYEQQCGEGQNECLTSDDYPF